MIILTSPFSIYITIQTFNKWFITHYNVIISKYKVFAHVQYFSTIATSPMKTYFILLQPCFAILSFIICLYISLYLWVAKTIYSISICCLYIWMCLPLDRELACLPTAVPLSKSWSEKTGITTHREWWMERTCRQTRICNPRRSTKNPGHPTKLKRKWR